MTKQELEQELLSKETQMANLGIKLQKQEKYKFEAVQEVIDLKKELSQIKWQLINRSIGNVADIRSLQNYLRIFSNESMTHNEKNYLARKIDLLCENMITERMSGIPQLFDKSDDLPF